ncbi:hypothetical protein CVT24_010267 [Panaeolus cyanescens]|uniref:G-protein coupled receptors family 3 profile domain-containing protein n=1 Tax=Panaeolus cyanescens TaxID=181874 RepID=A0A409YQ03_9AGAR|nr:hypothetical protein CVT24_010267 [Panaeolus cyanescens]
MILSIRNVGSHMVKEPSESMSLNRVPALTTPIDVPIVYTFVGIQLLSCLGLVALLLSAMLSSKIKRLATWYSFCASWILSCLSYSLLTLGGQQTAPSPNAPLCAVQAALIYSVPPLTSSTTLALLIQILLNFPNPAAETPTVTTTKVLCGLLIGPYVIFLVLFLGVIVFEVQNPETLVKTVQGTYCNSTDPAWLKVAFSLVAVVSVVILLVQGHLVTQLYALRRRVVKGESVASPSLTLTIRGFLFVCIGAITLTIAMVFTIKGVQNLAFDIVVSTFPLMAFLTFGTQRDLLCLWSSPFVTMHKRLSMSSRMVRESILFGKRISTQPPSRSLPIKSPI